MLRDKYYCTFTGSCNATMLRDKYYCTFTGSCNATMLRDKLHYTVPLLVHAISVILLKKNTFIEIKAKLHLKPWLPTQISTLALQIIEQHINVFQSNIVVLWNERKESNSEPFLVPDNDFKQKYQTYCLAVNYWTGSAIFNVNVNNYYPHMHINCFLSQIKVILSTRVRKNLRETVWKM